MLRQLLLFVPEMFLLLMTFGIKAAWVTEPVRDFIVIIIGIIVQHKI